jgi:hypothetical protein
VTLPIRRLRLRLRLRLRRRRRRRRRHHHHHPRIRFSLNYIKSAEHVVFAVNKKFE